MISNGRTFSYREICCLVDQLAAALTGLGIGGGDRVGIYLYNRPEMIVCYFACFKIGATVVPINYRLRSDEVHYIVNHAQPSILISERSLFSEVAALRDGLASVRHYYLVDWIEGEFENTRAFETLRSPGTSELPRMDVPGDTDAVILYTSGTTGNPKGATLTQRQMSIHTDQHRALVGYEEDDTTIVCLALSNNFAFSHQMLAAFRAGAALDILPRFDAQGVLSRIEHGRATMLYMMPVMYHSLVALADRLGHPVSNRLRLAIVAGDTTPSVVFEGFERWFGLALCEGIGMTETQIYALNPIGKGKKQGSVGAPVAYQQVQVQDHNGQALAVDEIGEIAVQSAIVTRCYLNNPEVTAESFRNGWFLTGDLGCFDTDGFLWFRGRRKQLIVHDGSNISPQEVEEVFYHHHAVSEVGVVGIPDAVEGENVRAFVALKPGAADINEEELLSFARRHLADYKLPEHITFVDALPKGSTGKIDRRQLKRSALQEDLDVVHEAENNKHQRTSTP